MRPIVSLLLLLVSIAAASQNRLANKLRKATSDHDGRTSAVFENQVLLDVAAKAALPSVTAYGGHFYEIVTKALTQEKAKDDAESSASNGLFGYLVVIDSPAENDFLAKLARSAGLNTFWMGGDDKETEGVWKWHSTAGQFYTGKGAAGRSVAGKYSNWESGEPNDYANNEDCVQMYVGSGRWNDLACGVALPYIIEYGSDAPPKKLSVQSFQGHFYSLFKVDKNWEDAAVFSRTLTYNGLKGYMSTINSAAENDFVRKMAPTTNRLWLGGTDQRSEGTWLWENNEGQFWRGNTPPNGGSAIPGYYTNFAPNQPDNWNKEDCIEMWANAQWNDLACASFGWFVVEFSPPPDPCSRNRGGCDPLTTCTAREGKAVCGPCPDGFSYDSTGSRCVGNGCKPMTQQPADGELGSCGDKIGHGTRCQIKCNDGFKVVGDPRLCNAGVLEGQPQQCLGSVCSALQIAPANGGLGTCGRAIGHTQTCSIECNPGFAVQGEPRRCTAGKLLGQEQTCSGVSCKALSDKPANGVIGTCDKDVSHGGACSISCEPGFTLIGDPLKCMGGKWINDMQQCVGNKCPAMTEAPASGSLGECGRDVLHSQTCSVSCNVGYTLQGGPRRCWAGKLEGEPQTCVGQGCRSLAEPPKNGQLDTCANPIAHGASCSVKCDDGFTLKGEPRTCSGGVLGGKDQFCDAAPCEALKTPPDKGQLGTCSAAMKHGEWCSYACEKGYTLTGKPYQCLQGQVKGEGQTCKGDPCAALTTPPDHGSLGSCTEEIQHGQSCGIQCAAGYSVVGEPRTCTAGVLGGTAQSCSGNVCPPLKDKPLNGALGNCGANVAHGTTCSAYCDKGFTLRGQPLKCEAGTLSGPEQTCEGDPCMPQTQTIENGNLDACGKPTDHGATCSIVCNDDFDIVGEPQACSGGQWKGAPQSCVGRPCQPMLDGPDMGALGECGGVVADGKMCSFKCDVGYEIRGSPRLCTRGVFQGDRQTCVPTKTEPAPVDEVQQRAEDFWSKLHKIREAIHIFEAKSQHEEHCDDDAKKFREDIQAFEDEFRVKGESDHTEETLCYAKLGKLKQRLSELAAAFDTEHPGELSPGETEGERAFNKLVDTLSKRVQLMEHKYKNRHMTHFCGDPPVEPLPPAPEGVDLNKWNRIVEFERKIRNLEGVIARTIRSQSRSMEQTIGDASRCPVSEADVKEAAEKEKLRNADWWINERWLDPVIIGGFRELSAKVSHPNRQQQQQRQPVEKQAELRPAIVAQGGGTSFVAAKVESSEGHQRVAGEDLLVGHSPKRKWVRA